MIQERADAAGTIIRGPGYFETGFHEELAQDAERAGKHFNSADLIAAMSANRHRVACLQLAVEEADRSGRHAAEVLAERVFPMSFWEKSDRS